MDNITSEILDSLNKKGLTVCISIASNPGKFGKTIHTAGYEALDLPFIYIPVRVTEDDLENIITLIKKQCIRGCSVTMPHKIKVIDYLDNLSDTASAVGAVNTIVNNDGELTGYNTDVVGALETLKKMDIKKSDSVVLLGSGGAAAAVSRALNKIGVDKITYAARNQEKAMELYEKFGGMAVVDWGLRENQHADLLINATPIGFGEYLDISPVSKEGLENFDKIFDLVPIQSDTELIRLSKDLGLDVAQGKDMVIEQAFAQFELYTGKKAPRKFIFDSLREKGVIK